MANDTVKLLIVDDEEFNCKLLMRHLNKEGYTNVDMAENGAQALEMARAGGYDLVMTDIEMPEMDGIAVLEAMKSDMRLRDVPVIMISGVEDMDSIVKCIELGAEDYLRKPFNPVMLRARVSASLEKKRLRDMEGMHLSQIKIEKKKSDDLLNVILPSLAAGELKATGKVIPRRYDDVAILFCDIVGFTSFCEKHDAEEVVSGLQSLFTAFEKITNDQGMEKIKTIGDEFMASAGLMRINSNPLLSAVKCGLDMADATAALDIGWEVRVGINAGPVIAGIVGDQKYQFDVWGDTVNTAARMAGQGAPGTVVMTYEAWLQVQDECQGRSLGQIEVKGKGKVELVECNGVL
ncbi:MAG: response regulator [Rhodospirillales bacterium]|jgi:adenylate cyclase|nr:response regulator [Rhodospirillales bacterium]